MYEPPGSSREYLLAIVKLGMLSSREVCTQMCDMSRRGRPAVEALQNFAEFREIVREKETIASVSHCSSLSHLPRSRQEDHLLILI